MSFAQKMTQPSSSGNHHPQWIEPQAKKMVFMAGYNATSSVLHHWKKDGNSAKQLLEMNERILKSILEDSYNTHNSSLPFRTVNYAKDAKDAISAELRGNFALFGEHIQDAKKIIARYIPDNLDATERKNILLLLKAQLEAAIPYLYNAAVAEMEIREEHTK